MALIQCSSLRKVYGTGDAKVAALDHASFSIDSGEFVSIMGPSGSGKSTLLQIIGLLSRPSSGKYYFDNQDTSELTDQELGFIRNQKIGFVFQSFHLLPRSTVLENVILPLQYSTTRPRDYIPKAKKALDEVQMSHRLNHRPTQLSGGEKQRVAIARALVNEPNLILADEPTGNLDSHTGAIVMDTIDALHSQGHTIILITHETPTAQYAQRIIEMIDGRISKDHPNHTSTHRHYQK
jgi:putative ABC transport system ATP-binding protein